MMNAAQHLYEARQHAERGRFSEAIVMCLDVAEADGVSETLHKRALDELEALSQRPDKPGTHPGFQYEAACALWVLDQARGLEALRRVAAASGLGPTRLHAANKLWHISDAQDGIAAMRAITEDREGGETRLLAARLLRTMAPAAVVNDTYALLVQAEELPVASRALAWAALREVAGPKAAAEYAVELLDNPRARRIMDSAEAAHPVRKGLGLR